MNVQNSNFIFLENSNRFPLSYVTEITFVAVSYDYFSRFFC